MLTRPEQIALAQVPSSGVVLGLYATGGKVSQFTDFSLDYC